MKRSFLGGFRIVFAAIFLACTIAVTAVAANVTFAKNEQKVRTVSYALNAYFEADFVEQFDDFEIVENDNQINISATKTFSTAIFEEIDLVSEETEESFTVRYEVDYLGDDDTVLLRAYTVGEETEELTDTIPGLVTYNEEGKTDILFNVDEEYIWLSELTNEKQVDEAGWLKNLVKKVANKVKEIATNIAKAVKGAVDTVIDKVQQAVNKVIAVIAPVIKPIVETTLKLAYKVLGEERAAKWGAALLMMYEEPNKPGVFHSAFDCWQQYFGYIDVYDNVFRASTAMDVKEFEFTYNNWDYKFWAWKGDYLNLGTGCELGIYKRWEWGKNIWKVDKNLAMPMTAKLTHGSNTVIDWNPSKYNGKKVNVLGNAITATITTNQWWITGFNSKYKQADYNKNKNVPYEKQLKATFTADLSKTNFYNVFYTKFKKEIESTNSNKNLAMNGKVLTITF